MKSNRPFGLERKADSNESPAFVRDLDDQAMTWVLRLTSGLADEEERDAFVRWRDQSPAHARALAEARALWTGVGPALVAGQERRLAEEFMGSLRTAPRRRAAGDARGRRPPQARAQVNVRRFAGAAAAVAVAISATAFMTQSPFADVKTGGVVESSMLADGTSVMLAPDTAMNVDFRPDGERHIDLAKGEVMFDVAHDPSRPFVINSGGGQIRVLGTAFSVKKTGGMTRVIVTRGLVEVSSGAERRVLKPDRMVVYGLTTMGGIRAVDANAATGWTNGRLIFENQSLGDVIAELDRFEPRKVVLLNREARRKRVNAVIDLNRTGYWLSALEKSEGVEVTTLPGMIVIR